MSGLCGFVGDANPTVLDAMLEAIAYRGDTQQTVLGHGAAMGYRFFAGRPGRSAEILREGPHLVGCAGGLSPAVDSPVRTLLQRMQSNALADVDGTFAAAWWDGNRLTLVRDPFGVRSLYYTRHKGVFYFASELKQLLAIEGVQVELNEPAIHKYLTFSFIPGEDLPIRGMRRLLPGHVAVMAGGDPVCTPYFSLREDVDPDFSDETLAIRRTRKLLKAAVAKRINGEREVGLFLSGGIDSSAVGWALLSAGVSVRGFSLDFGEREEAKAAAAALKIPLQIVPVSGQDIAGLLEALSYRLDLPFGDPVTGPQYLLGRAARAAGLDVVFNGEGGDQLFGGWTNKPMIAAALYSGLYEDESREESYLRSYHRFYDREDALYTEAFSARIGGAGQRRAILRPHLGGDGTFLGKIRFADLMLKGCLNIIPRAERMGSAWGLDVRMPLFDRDLAQFAFRLPPALKLKGTVEKYVLKRAVRRLLPRDIVWRPKSGMCVPITEWLTGPLAPLVEDYLGKASLDKRGLFRDEYVRTLRNGTHEPGEARKRRVGERLWTLIMLEAWMRAFVDRK